MSVTIKIGYAADERLAENFAGDLDWINERRIELYEEYGSCVILVYHQEVIGTGKDLKEAVANAEDNLSDREGIVTPIIKMLSNPHRIGLLRLRQIPAME